MSDPIVMVQAFAELRYGVVVHTRENSVKYGHNFIPLQFIDKRAFCSAVGVVGVVHAWVGQIVLPPSSERLSIAISQKRLGVTPIFEARIVFFDQNWV